MRDAADCRGELEALLAEAEGDPADPFGGWCFRWEDAPPWVTADGKGRERVSATALAKSVMARRHVIKLTTEQGRPVRYRYCDGVYRLCTEEDVRELLQAEIFSYSDALYKGSLISEAAGIILQSPAAGTLEEMDADETVVNFKNGLLDLRTLRLRPHSPALLSSVQLDAEWTGLDEPTPVFSAFMKQLTGGSVPQARLLMEFMGLCLTNVPGWKTKKALFMVGPGNTGKSVARGLTEARLGRGNYASVPLSALEGDKFAAAQLFGRRLAGAGDLGFLRMPELAMFKQLTGGDRISGEFKGKDAFPFRYHGLLWVGMNEAPLFGGDKGEWVYERMLLFPCANPVPEEQRDPDLLQKLLSERNRIVRRLIAAAKRVVENGCRFDIPEETVAARTAYRRRNDPAETFLHECCVRRESTEISPLDECTCKNVFEVFRLWCRDNNNGYVPKKSEFRRTAAAFYGVEEEELIIKKEKNNYYRFTLKPETKAELEGTVFLKRA